MEEQNSLVLNNPLLEAIKAAIDAGTIEKNRTYGRLVALGSSQSLL